MRNVLIYGMGRIYEQYILAIKWQESRGIFNVVGVTSNDKYTDFIDGYPFIQKKDIDKYDIDVCIVCTMSSIEEAKKELLLLFGDRKPYIILPKAILHPDFDMDKYICLIDSRVSIMSNVCWGGATYNSLGLRFESPFINIFVEPDNFIRIMFDLKKYMCEPLECAYMDFNANENHNYPIGKLGDVLLYMFHECDFEKAREKWEERKARINWNNILFSMWTNDIEMIKKIDKIEEKKIVFTEINVEKDYIVNLNPNRYLLGNKKDTERNAIAHKMNACATGRIKKYNIYDLLISGVVKETERIK